MLKGMRETFILQRISLLHLYVVPYIISASFEPKERAAVRSNVLKPFTCPLQNSRRKRPKKWLISITVSKIHTFVDPKCTTIQHVKRGGYAFSARILLLQNMFNLYEVKPPLSVYKHTFRETCIALEIYVYGLSRQFAKSSCKMI